MGTIILVLINMILRSEIVIHYYDEVMNIASFKQISYHLILLNYVMRSYYYYYIIIKLLSKI